MIRKYDGDVLLVKAYSKRAAARSIDMSLFAPIWMDLAVSGIHTDVMIDGTKGRVRVETVHGDIAVSGGREQIELNAVNQDIHLVDASGIVLSETVNGDMILQRIDSDSVDVSTVNGEIFYEGSIHNRGVYRFTSHNGDIAVALPKTADAMVNVSTFSGDFASEFPVSLTETKKGRQFCFILGRGSARVDLESFQGTIHIFRPGREGRWRTWRLLRSSPCPSPRPLPSPQGPQGEARVRWRRRGLRVPGSEPEQLSAPDAPEATGTRKKSIPRPRFRPTRRTATRRQRLRGARVLREREPELRRPTVSGHVQDHRQPVLAARDDHLGIR